MTSEGVFQLKGPLAPYLEQGINGICFGKRADGLTEISCDWLPLNIYSSFAAKLSTELPCSWRECNKMGVADWRSRLSAVREHDEQRDMEKKSKTHNGKST